MLTNSSDSARSSDRTLNITRVFEAPRELVFKLWVMPEHVVRWYGPEGYFLSHCSIEAIVGGAWRFCMTRPDGYQHWISGTYREIAPPERLSFSYTNDYDGREMLVELAFDDLGDRTRMQFRQAPFTDAAQRDGHSFGWNSGLDLLAAYAKACAAADGEPLGQPRSAATIGVAAQSRE